MTDLAAVDYFFDQLVAQDPYEYFEYLRASTRSFANPTTASSP